jgi:hydrogenase expression/formation protein HypC
MCLGVPGQIIRWVDRDPLFATAEVDFGGLRRVCHMACVTDAAEGDYVVVHAGLAISRIDAGEAQRVFAELRQMGADDELRQEAPS